MGADILGTLPIQTTIRHLGFTHPASRNMDNKVYFSNMIGSY
jgi:hypothetical protein